MKDFIPLITPVVAIILFIIGVMIWRVQLVSKRKFEVAEQTMVAFIKASDALAKIRSPVYYKGTWHWPMFPPSNDLVPANEVESYKAHHISVYNERFAAAEPAFAELRVVHILTEVHFGSEASALFGGLQASKASAESSFALLFKTLPDLADNRDRFGEVLNQAELAKRAASALTPYPENTPELDLGDSSEKIEQTRKDLFAVLRPALVNADLNAAKPWIGRILNLFIDPVVIEITGKAFEKVARRIDGVARMLEDLANSTRRKS